LESGAALLLGSSLLAESVAAAPQSIYDFTALQYDKEVSLSKYKGQVLVVVNIASE
jgi:hypothetical protein